MVFFFGLVFFIPLWASVHLRVCHFPISILGQVWYLIVSITDRCTLACFGSTIVVDTFNHKSYALKLNCFLF